MTSRRTHGREGVVISYDVVKCAKFRGPLYFGIAKIYIVNFQLRNVYESRCMLRTFDFCLTEMYFFVPLHKL
uniref:Uncharacterized protein n=1 Tax=Physcomitrium patens TaxID=3218 RepID=A0A7I3ZCV8_PHYPA